MPDDTRTLAVKGVSGFFESTTIGLTKYQNSDLVSSVSSEAENLVPKRLGQFASVLATVVQVSSVVKKAPGTHPQSLEPFVIAVPSKTDSNTINDDWNWSFTYDAGEPAGTVSYHDFMTRSIDRTVSYFPTPACRTATLKIDRRSDRSVSQFHLVVVAPDLIRLQSLPVKGKIDLGTVCGASVSGTQSSDTLASISDDLSAFQSAVKTVKDATNGGAKTPAAASGVAAGKQK
ncbi:hypothetical protein [Candidatus Burkholderia verschuerenii]|uniref:hypothetical protein n=1 Tax=Candidatus Burkholderia verschuerenii TaxID=242163 RepID=UPI000A494DEE|nr:hypothetical protein [Candidatus Burkholderia verschuerenii]